MAGEYVAVTNIPSHFHAADLRAHFSSFVENKSFICFHFRHRPEKSSLDKKQSESPESQSHSQTQTEDTSVLSQPNAKTTISNNISHHHHSESSGRTPSSQTNLSNGGLSVSSTRGSNHGTKCCVIKVTVPKCDDFLTKYNKHEWTDVNGHYLGNLCQLSVIRTRTCHIAEATRIVDTAGNSGQDVVDEKDLLAMPELRPPELMPNGNVGTPTLVFLDFIQKCLLPKSIINKLHLRFPSINAKRLYSNVNFKYEETVGPISKHQDPDQSKSGSNTDIDCRSFQQSTSSKKNFASKSSPAAFISPEASYAPSSFSSDNSISSEKEKSRIREGTLSEDNILSEKSPQISTEKCSVHKLKSDFVSPSSSMMSKDDTKTFSKPVDAALDQSDHLPRELLRRQALTGREKKQLAKEERRKIRALMNEGIEEHLIRIEKRYHNEEDAEEWDRHEATEDDPSNQERNKERLYEEEIEQPWEKGGPGVVFYTDAMYWQAKEGDFDEQTTDDLDVDFSPYEGDGRGDKDIQDFLKIRQEKRFRDGYDQTDRFSIGLSKRNGSIPLASHPVSAIHLRPRPAGAALGQFESHTKGIGRKVMEKHGWQDGQGLGATGSGIKQALRGEGQRPQIKRGLGFVESEPARYGPSVLKKAWVFKPPASHLITTSNDDPHVTDPKEPLLQRNEPTHLKHRKTFLDTHPS